MPEIDEEPYQSTPAERRMANSINFLIQMMLRGELVGISLAAVNLEGEHTCLYFNKPVVGVLGPAIEELRVMYETNQSFRHLDTSPPNNKSYRMH